MGWAFVSQGMERKTVYPENYTLVPRGQIPREGLHGPWESSECPPDGMHRWGCYISRLGTSLGNMICGPLSMQPHPLGEADWPAGLTNVEVHDSSLMAQRHPGSSSLAILLLVLHSRLLTRCLMTGRWKVGQQALPMKYRSTSVLSLI